MNRWKVGLAIAAILCGVEFTLAQQAADTVLYNGKVLTVDRNFSVAEDSPAQFTKATDRRKGSIGCCRFCACRTCGEYANAIRPGCFFISKWRNDGV